MVRGKHFFTFAEHTDPKDALQTFPFGRWLFQYIPGLATLLSAGRFPLRRHRRPFGGRCCISSMPAGLPTNRYPIKKFWSKANSRQPFKETGTRGSWTSPMAPSFPRVSSLDFNHTER